MQTSNSYFLTRQLANLLQQLQVLLRAESAECVFLCAPPQSGKSAFARQLESRLRPHLPVIWLNVEAGDWLLQSEGEQPIRLRESHRDQELAAFFSQYPGDPVLLVEGLEAASQTVLQPLWQVLSHAALQKMVLLRHELPELSLQQQLKQAGWSSIRVYQLPPLNRDEAWSLLQQSSGLDETRRVLDPACKKHLPQAPIWPARVLEQAVLCQNQGVSKASPAGLAGGYWKPLSMVLSAIIVLFGVALAWRANEAVPSRTEVVVSSQQSEAKIQADSGAETPLPASGQDKQAEIVLEDEHVKQDDSQPLILAAEPEQLDPPLAWNDALQAQQAAQSWLNRASPTQATIQVSSAVLERNESGEVRQSGWLALQREVLALRQDFPDQEPMLFFSQTGQRLLVTVCTGQFKTLSQARETLDALPAQWQKRKPIMRSAGGLQRQLGSQSSR